MPAIPSTIFYLRKSRDSIPWPNLPWICVRRVNHATDQVWRQLDAVLWELTHNPWVVLQTVSRDQIERVLADPAFRKNVNDLVQARRDAAQAPAWFQQNYKQASLSCVAYFSMEFMLSEALPIYSGGLGNVQAISSKLPAILACR